MKRAVEIVVLWWYKCCFILISVENFHTAKKNDSSPLIEHVLSLLYVDEIEMNAEVDG